MMIMTMMVMMVMMIMIVMVIGLLVDAGDVSGNVAGFEEGRTVMIRKLIRAFVRYNLLGRFR